MQRHPRGSHCSQGCSAVFITANATGTAARAAPHRIDISGMPGGKKVEKSPNLPTISVCSGPFKTAIS